MAVTKEPLTDGEFDRMAAILERSTRAMNLEMLDGFFAALICSPDIIRPSEYLREIWGGDRFGGAGWRDEEEMQEFMGLMMRHWNCVAGTLYTGEPFMPFLLENDAGVAHANEWAQGFMRGTGLRRDDWIGLFYDQRLCPRHCWLSFGSPPIVSGHFSYHVYCRQHIPSKYSTPGSETSFSLIILDRLAHRAPVQ